MKQTQYDYVHVLAVASPVTGHSEVLIAPVLNASVVNTFLDQFSKYLPADVHTALIWDGAGYHTAEAIRRPANVALITLPPYSPELNPIENLWHHLRSHHGSNRHYKDVDALYDAAEDGWRKCLPRRGDGQVGVRRPLRQKRSYHLRRVVEDSGCSGSTTNASPKDRRSLNVCGCSAITSTKGSADGIGGTTWIVSCA